MAHEAITDAQLVAWAHMACDGAAEAMRALPGVAPAATDVILARAMLVKAKELLRGGGFTLVIGTTSITLPRTACATTIEEFHASR